MSVNVETAVARTGDRFFYGGMALAIAATACVAFTHSLLRTDLGSKLQYFWVQAHAVTFIGWLLLLLTQTALIASHRIDLHRRLGVAGAVLAAMMTLLAAMSAVHSFQEDALPLGLISIAYFLVPHVDMVIFATLVTAGLLLRHEPGTHKRLLLLASIALLDAVTSRLPVVWRIGPDAHFVVLDLFVIAGVVHDLVRERRLHHAYVWGGLMILILPPAADPAYMALKALLDGS